MADARWSELPPEPLAIELAKLGITPKVLALDIRDVPEHRDACKLLSPEARLALALEWFGDQAHPQPEERTRWQTFGYTPDWEQLPRLEDDEPADRLQRRDPLPTLATTEAVRLRVVQDESWPRIEESLELSHRKVDYVRLALKHGDLGWDLDRGCITLGPETRNTPAGLVLPAR
jgi:hypothetical protein